MIPVYLKGPDGPSPPEGTHYIIARNGNFLRKREWWVDATVPVRQISVLDRQKPLAELLLPTLPAEVLAKASRLAKVVYDISQSEVCLLLHYNVEAGYQLSVPKQTVSPGRIDYDASERLSGALCVGTLHSHGALEAYHSDIDLEDETYADGVHITLGEVHKYPAFSLSAEVVVNGTRFSIDRTWFAGLVPRGTGYRVDCLAIESWEVPAKWLEVIRHPGWRRPLLEQEKKLDD